MNEDDWFDKFQPVAKDGLLLFDPTDETDRAFLDMIDPHHIWTEVDSGEASEYAVLPGVRLVNRIGYLVTVVPWAEDDADLVVLMDA
jgi:hypothetical protein